MIDYPNKKIPHGQHETRNRLDKSKNHNDTPSRCNRKFKGSITSARSKIRIYLAAVSRVSLFIFAPRREESPAPLRDLKKNGPKWRSSETQYNPPSEYRSRCERSSVTLLLAPRGALAPTNSPRWLFQSFLHTRAALFFCQPRLIREQ